MKQFLTFLIILVLSNEAWGADNKGNYMKFGTGNKSCAYYTKHNKNKDLLGYLNRQWVLGFITSYNVYTSGIHDIAKGTEADGLFAWIDQYCSKNPLDTISTSTIYLIQHLKSRR